jgi:hypothetical protein
MLLLIIISLSKNRFVEDVTLITAAQSWFAAYSSISNGSLATTKGRLDTYSYELRKLAFPGASG